MLYDYLGLSDMEFQSTQPEWAATSTTTNSKDEDGEFQSTQPEWAATCNS